MSLDGAISVFETHKEEVLTFPVVIKGKQDEMYVLRELMLDEDTTGDPTKLGERLQKLPALLVFYGNLMDAATRQHEQAKEAFDIWYADEAERVNKKYLEEMEKSSLPASLKKPLTIDQLKGKVMTSNPTTSKESREQLSRAEERLALLRRFVEGLNAAIRLVVSETSLMTALVTKGLVEPVGSPKQSRLNGFMSKNP